MKWKTLPFLVFVPLLILQKIWPIIVKTICSCVNVGVVPLGIGSLHFDSAWNPIPTDLYSHSIIVTVLLYTSCSSSNAICVFSLLTVHANLFCINPLVYCFATVAMETYPWRARISSHNSRDYVTLLSDVITFFGCNFFKKIFFPGVKRLPFHVIISTSREVWVVVE